MKFSAAELRELLEYTTSRYHIDPDEALPAKLRKMLAKMK